MGVKMLKFSSLTAMALVLSVTAARADGIMSFKDAPPAMSWGGMYIGGTVGYGWGSSEAWYDEPDDHPGHVTNDPSGGVIGVTIGYNHQINDRWVMGLEGDLSMSSISGDDNTCMWDDHCWQTGWGGLFTLRGRVGYDLGGNLIYGTAGIAAVDSHEHINGDNADQSTNNGGWNWGWVVGLGVERQFNERWSGKIEYLHVGLGEDTGTLYANGNQVNYGFDQSLDLLRVGVNYKIH